ncbi:MAG: hypothetical protein ACYC01_04725 [Lutibacter sp.]
MVLKKVGRPKTEGSSENKKVQKIIKKQLERDLYLTGKELKVNFGFPIDDLRIWLFDIFNSKIENQIS